MTTAPMRDDYLSWGRVNRYRQRVIRPEFVDQLPAAMTTLAATGKLLPRGLGRSYGDSGLNEDGGLLDMCRLDRFIAFDRETGVLECEAGVSLHAILRLLDDLPTPGPRWFLPVTPGTRYVTVGGAIANDVHGKNHHRTGCFGNHLRAFRLLRSDGALLTCSTGENVALFHATIGGLGLTGVIVSAEFNLLPVEGPWLETEHQRYDRLEQFYALSEAALNDWAYSVAWIDCLATGRNRGRGIFTRARHAALPPDAGRHKTPASRRLPIDLPSIALNRSSIAAFNNLLWRRAPRISRRGIEHYAPVFYPLDAIDDFNRLYGRRGFFQFQCAIPAATAPDAIDTLLETIAAAGMGSFLAVLKTLGDRRSPGLMSFPLAGTTLALDFPNRGAATRRLLDRLYRITVDTGGRIYPAKDGCIGAEDFQRAYPRWREFATHIDPAFSSSFWRRVSAGG